MKHSLKVTFAQWDSPKVGMIDVTLEDEKGIVYHAQIEPCEECNDETILS